MSATSTVSHMSVWHLSRYADGKGDADVLNGVDSDYMDIPAVDAEDANATGGYMDVDMADDTGFDGEGDGEF